MTPNTTLDAVERPYHHGDLRRAIVETASAMLREDKGWQFTLREVARQVPADRLLIETDAPYLAPIPHRGKPNLPEYVRDVAEFLAPLRGVDVDTLAEQTTQNFQRLFPLARVNRR